MTMKMPTAFTGPTVRVEASSAKISTSMAAITVPALAKIAGAARGIAIRSASCLSSCVCSSSTYLATSSRQ